MKYTIKTEVEAVKVVDKDASSIAGIAELFVGIPHFYEEGGLVINPDMDESDLIEYGNYLVKEKHGFSVMSAELFESISVPVDITNYDAIQGEDITIGKLRDYLNQLPVNVMTKEVWTEQEGLSTQCNFVLPLNKREGDDFDIILGSQHEPA